MLAKLAAFAQNKLALVVLSTLFLGGGSTALAVAASGQTAGRHATPASATQHQDGVHSQSGNQNKVSNEAENEQEAENEHEAEHEAEDEHEDEQEAEHAHTGGGTTSSG